LNDVDRIADRNYLPTDDDIIRARLRTMGVQEYKFTVDYGGLRLHLLHLHLLPLWMCPGKELGREWLMYDVGGTRSSVSVH